MAKANSKQYEEVEKFNPTRLSVTLPADHYAQLQHLATKKRVSVAWVVRDAVERYLINGKPADKEER